MTRLALALVLLLALALPATANNVYAVTVSRIDGDVYRVHAHPDWYLRIEPKCHWSAEGAEETAMLVVLDDEALHVLIFDPDDFDEVCWIAGEAWSRGDLP